MARAGLPSRARTSYNLSEVPVDRHILLRLHLLVLLFAAAACDRASSSSSPGVTLPGKPAADLQPLAQLDSNRTVHVAVDNLGNAFYSVETEKGADGAVIVGDNGIPRATQLTSSNILAAMGETYGGSGTIGDLIAGPEGTFYFYFVGGKGRAVRACVGQFTVRDETIHILFNTNRLADMTGMGSSIELARATFVRSGAKVYLLLRHTDAWSVLSFDAKRFAPGVDFRLARAFEKIVATGDEQQELDLRSERYELSAGVGENLLLVDLKTGMMWQVDPAGRATLRMILTGLPREMSRPIVVKNDHLLIFAANSEPIEADVSDAMIARNLPRTTYPAILEIAGKKISAIGREDLHVYGGFPSYELRIHDLVAAPDGSFVAYDLASGQLMRIRLVTSGE
jgi:hypothetical protein